MYFHIKVGHMQSVLQYVCRYIDIYIYKYISKICANTLLMAILIYTKKIKLKNLYLRWHAVTTDSGQTL